MLTLLLLLPLGMSAWAQQIKITGTVRDQSTNEALPGTNVLVKGSQTGTATDATGRYTLTADPKATLVFSSIGYLNQEIALNNRATLDVTLATDVLSLNEVVVTALGITREKKALGYATQELKGSDLTDARTPNVINNLAGKVAGIVINPGSQGPGASSRVVLRGDRSLSPNPTANQPLYVIDGVPMDNTQPGQVGEFGGADLGDGIGNLNPDDIEAISVLRGATAAALYGSRANNGVIMITTRKGTATKGIGVNYRLDHSTDAPMYKLNFQDQYGQGAAGNYLVGEVSSWGPRIAGQSVTDFTGRTTSLTNQDQVGSFLQNGSNTTHSVSVNSGTEKAQVYFSAQNLLSNGLIPNNKLNRTTLNLRGTMQLGSKLSLDTKITFINQRLDNRPSGGEEASNPYSNAIRMPGTVPTDALQNFETTVNGLLRQNFFLANSTIIANPYYVANRINLNQLRNRILGMATATYQFNSHLSLLARAGVDTYFDNDERKVFAGAPLPLSGNSIGGDYSTATRRASELNADFLLMYNTNLSKDLKLSASGGGNLRRSLFSSSNQSAGGLDFANFFSIVNGINRVNGQGYTEQVVQSLYATGQLAVKEFLFLDITGRNDWSSTLPSSAWSFFYPSVSASLVLSEAVKLPDLISFAKVRASWAQVGNGTDPYQTVQYFNASNGIAGTVLAATPQSTIGDRLKAERTTSYEAGLELKLLKNRIGLDFTFYRSNSRNQLVALPLNPTSGYTSRFQNLGNVQNQGIEILLSGTPVQLASGFRWNTMLNYTRNRNLIVELDPEGKISNLALGNNRMVSVQAINGQRMGELVGRGFERNAAGAVLINQATGLPFVKANTYLGNANPDWLAGITNSLSYKGFRLEFLIDGRFGGIVASHTQSVLASLGRTTETLNGRETASPLISGGVLALRNPATATEPFRNVNALGEASGTPVANTIGVSAQTYWSAAGARGGPVSELFTYDATNVRLRQFTLGYRLPSAWFNGSPVRNIDLSIYGRNLFFFSRTAPFDPEVALNTGFNGQGLDFYALPSLRSFGASLNIGF